MIKKNKWKLLISSLVILLPVVFGLLFWGKLPQQMVTHWGVNGTADGYSSRFSAVVLLPLFLLLIQWICVFFTARDPGNSEQNGKVFGLILWVVPLISLFSNAAIYAAAFGKEWDSLMLPALLLGVVLTVVGNYLPKCRRNRTIGIRVKWTMENEENWNATHRFGGKVFMAGGLVILAAMLLPDEAAEAVMLAALLLTVVIPIAYSYVYHKRQMQKGTAVQTPIKDQLPKGKTAVVSCVMAVVVLVLVGVLMFTGDISVQYGEESFTVQASYWNALTVDYDVIESIEYRDAEMKGIRTFGLGTARLLAGAFRNEEFGAYTRYTYAGVDACVIIRADGKTLVIGGKDEADTQAIHEAIKAHLE